MLKALKLSNVLQKSNRIWTGFSFFSTQTLFSRILSPRGNAKVSIVPILERWDQEGRPIQESDSRTLLKLLRNKNRYAHALQLAEWMTKDSKLSPGDVAVRLDLISRVHGLEEAEKYFSSLPDTLVTFKVYGSLLNCYAQRREVGKAEAIMQTMRSLDCDMSLSYSLMLNLYLQLGKRQKFDKLVQEMEEKGINFCQAMFCVMLNAYATDSNIQAMEKLFKKMENDPLARVNWDVYCVVAKGYLRAGLADKASEMLMKAEKLVGRDGRLASRILLSMYASLGEKDKVLQIWNKHKKRGNVANTDYFYIMSCLVRLDDIDGAEKVFQEWESAKTKHEFRIPNSLINAYSKKGLLPKAEALFNRAVDSGRKVRSNKWNHLATMYCKDNQMDNAVDSMRKAVVAHQGHDWKLNDSTLRACLEYLKQKGDTEHEEFAKLLDKHGIVLNEFAETHENGGSDTGTIDELQANHEELDFLSSGSNAARD
ncbi:OLC1v1023981C1 [Oldenlandia corymbosa var. corymbosa]|uniref:OLC1v1023981C1 n=1 Tax=Oldenlandia corymbosa var. corymbosa TaxID=529605 RepID=A0AAV1C3Q1_OLDCO|nr:OLC1v1023981C1 [Oldenlandia corymbosa var. corymbosa]